MNSSRQAGAETYWARLAEGALAWESWGEQHAVFDSLSGDTHLLPELTAQVLRKLADRVCSASEIAETVCAETDDLCDEQFVMSITRVLQQLQVVGLVEKRDP